MASDGVRQGYDLASCRRSARICQVPLVASGGAGAPGAFRRRVRATGVDAALAASVFHSGAIAIPDLKHFLRAQHVEVRP